MAITGKFVADFAAFYDAVTKAEVSLRSFETGSNKVESALNRMVDSFSGRKIITDAQLMTEAVDRIGGVSKLTEKELARVGVTANEAAAKMRAMGIDVPPGLQKIADATKGIGVAASGSTSLLSGLAGQMAGMFTVGAVIQFGRSILQAGDHIQKMADQTSLGTDEVQRLMYIAGQSGTSIESLVGAVQNLQQRLGDESSGATGAMKKLGINADAFNKLDTYVQMTTLAEAVRGIKDPTEQASVAAALFGKTWKEILPAIKAGMKETGDQATIMADDTIKSLDRVGDTLTAAKGQMTAWGGSVVTAIESAGFAFGNFLSLFNPDHLGVSSVELLKLAKIINDPSGLKGALQSVHSPALAVGEALRAMVPGQLPADIAALNRAWEEDVVRMKAASEEARRLSAEFKETQKTVQMVEQSVRASRAAGLMGMLADEQKASQQTFEAWLTAYAAIEKAATTQADTSVRVAKEAAEEMTVVFIGVAEKVAAVSQKITADFNQAQAQYSLYGGSPSTPESQRAYQNSPAGLRQGILDRFERFESAMRNNTVPKFDTGGPTRGGLSMLHDGEYVVPKGGALVRGGGGTIVNNIYITQPFGTPDAIGDAIIARQRAHGVRFPSES